MCGGRGGGGPECAGRLEFPLRSLTLTGRERTLTLYSFLYIYSVHDFI